MTTTWEAFDRVEKEDWDLVVCSLAMRFGKQNLYAALWTARPEVKRRFAFLVDGPVHARATARPLTPAPIRTLLDNGYVLG